MKSFAEHIEQLRTEQRQRREKWMELIRDFISDSTPEKEVLELCQVVKFLLHISDNARIIEKRESPDFIVTVGNNNFGLEIERKFGKDAARIQSCNLLCRKAEQVFKERYPNEKILVNIYLTDNFTYKGAQKKDLIEQIVDYVYRELKQTSPKKPDFITEIFAMPHSGISFSYNPGAYMVQDLTEEAVIEAIEKKEKLVESYIENSGIDEQWLLIVVGQASPDSYEIEDLKINSEIITKFERIYILEDFNDALTRIH